MHRGRAEIDPAWLAEGADGLLALSGGDAGNVAQAILDDKPDAARAAAAGWRAVSRALLSGVAALRPAAYRTPDRRACSTSARR